MESCDAYVDWLWMGLGDHERDHRAFTVLYDHQIQGQVTWFVCGAANAHNALMAIASAVTHGIDAQDAMGDYTGVKRRLEWIGEVRGVRVYDDFAHHPMAIANSIVTLQHAPGRLIALLELV